MGIDFESQCGATDGSPEPDWFTLVATLRTRVVEVLTPLADGPRLSAVALDSRPGHGQLDLALRLETDQQDFELGDWSHPHYTEGALCPEVARAFRDYYELRTRVLDDAAGAKAKVLACCVTVLSDAEVMVLITSLPGSPVPYVGDTDDPEARNLVGL